MTTNATPRRQPEAIYEPPHDCELCPRLQAFRNETNEKNPSWFNGAVPSFGPDSARLLIVGLAPGLQGANRTGRPFTGDYAGDLLYDTLETFKLSRGTYAAHPDDDLSLVDCMITNAVRCVPPKNKPTGAEIKTCQRFLSARIAALPKLKVIIVLGRIAHDSTVVALGLKRSGIPFSHGAAHSVSDSEGRHLTLISSYHCSRYNTNTKRLTPDMFHDVFREAKKHLNT
jgi:uracil-DNA glycosylase